MLKLCPSHGGWDLYWFMTAIRHVIRYQIQSQIKETTMVGQTNLLRSPFWLSEMSLFSDAIFAKLLELGPPHYKMVVYRLVAYWALKLHCRQFWDVLRPLKRWISQINFFHAECLLCFVEFLKMKCPTRGSAGWKYVLLSSPQWQKWPRHSVHFLIPRAT